MLDLLSTSGSVFVAWVLLHVLGSESGVVMMLGGSDDVRG